MFAWLKKRRYRNETLGGVLALLNLTEDGADKVILKAYPGVNGAINTHYQEGSEPLYAGVMIALALLENMLDNIGDDERQQMLDDPKSSTLILRTAWMLDLTDKIEKKGGLPKGTFDMVYSHVKDAIVIGDPEGRIERSLLMAAGLLPEEEITED